MEKLHEKRKDEIEKFEKIRFSSGVKRKERKKNKSYKSLEENDKKND